MAAAAHGSPLAQPVEDVRNDVRQGYVSVQDAAALYGVVIDPETFVADEEETGRLRARLSSREALEPAAAPE